MVAVAVVVMVVLVVTSLVMKTFSTITISTNGSGDARLRGPGPAHCFKGLLEKTALPFSLCSHPRKSDRRWILEEAGGRRAPGWDCPAQEPLVLPSHIVERPPSLRHTPSSGRLGGHPGGGA